jgi:hypothetical protein
MISEPIRKKINTAYIKEFLLCYPKKTDEERFDYLCRMISFLITYLPEDFMNNIPGYNPDYTCPSNRFSLSALSYCRQFIIIIEKYPPPAPGRFIPEGLFYCASPIKGGDIGLLFRNLILFFYAAYSAYQTAGELLDSIDSIIRKLEQVNPPQSEVPFTRYRQLADEKIILEHLCEIGLLSAPTGVEIDNRINRFYKEQFDFDMFCETII